MKTIKEMTLQEKIGQLILAGFHSYEYDEHLQKIIDERHIGNVILFTRNFKDAKQMYALTKDIHKHAIESNGVIPFIGIDQEGGLVTRMMKDVTFAPGPMTCSASGHPASFETGKMLAGDMIRLGMNLNLAPSLDINNNPNNPVINVRSFSDNKEIVSDFGSEFIRGTLTYGVLPCAKHFPGHGDCAVDSHLGLPTINYGPDRLREMEMYPFKRNINVPCIMSAHIMFPEYDKEYPATLSKAMITGVLREELGYKGIIFSDCLEMKAIQDNYGTPEGALQAILAGVDIVDISHTLDYQLRALDLIEEAVKDGRLPMKTLDEKVERILKAKEATLPYLEKYFYSQNEPQFNQEQKVLAQEIVNNSLTLVKGSNVALTKNTLVIAPRAIAKTIIEDEFDDRNIAKVLSHEFPYLSVREYEDGEEFTNSVLESLSQYDNVIIFSYNANVNPQQVKFINSILSVNKAHVISLKGPFDFHKYENLENYICMYEYTPNSIRTIVSYFNGIIKPMGKLPVKL